MSDRSDIEIIHSLTKRLEASVKQKEFKNDHEDYTDINDQILTIESEISKHYNAGKMRRREAKLLRKRLKRLILPVRQFVYTDIKVPDQKINFSERKDFSAIVENKIEKGKEPSGKFFKNPFMDIGSNDITGPEIKENENHPGIKKVNSDQPPSSTLDENSCVFNDNDESKHIFSEEPEKLNILGDDLPEWQELYPKLPFTISEKIQKLFFNEYEFVDIFKYLFSSILWTMLKLKFSEALDKGAFIDDVEKEMFQEDGKKIEYPVKALNIIKKRMGGLKDYDSRMMPYKTHTKKRKEFICRTYLFRHCVLIGIKKNSIQTYVESLFSEVEKDIDKFVLVVRDNINNAKRERLNAGNFIAENFPEIMHRLRNVESHREPTWFKNEKFPKHEFYKTCLSSMKEAILEWLYAERWLMELTVGKKIGEIGNYSYFSTARPGGNPIKFHSDNKVLNKNEDKEFVIDLKNMVVLFPYKNLEGR